MTDLIIENFCDKFNNLTKKPDKFLSAPENLIDNLKDLIKQTYDFTKKEETVLISDTLPELITDNFDIEQIWQQIELQNQNILTEYLSSVSRLVAARDRLWFMNEESEFDHENNEEINENNEEESLSENVPENTQMEEESEESSSEDETNEPIEQLQPKQKSIVDDDFFKLNEMEQFLKKEEQTDNKNNSDESDDEESVDLFDKTEEMVDEDSETEINPKYDDFFGEAQQNENHSRKRKFSEDCEEENVKSSLELREERLKQKIEDIEEAALREKPWQLTGEITADKRPQNSLLEEIVDFDMTVRPAPTITEETTFRLEDIIKQRIKDKVYDDVERKTKLIETPTEYKKKLLLDQEKSKQSLAQIYENEFLKEQENLNPTEKPEEEPKEHQEIKTMMKSLFSKLDALSNFHFTPKTVEPELRIVNNLPAITIEEVAPIATSDAALLAPEEIKRKLKGDEIAKAERTDTDKNRERRKKKLKQSQHAKAKNQKEKLLQKMKPGLGNKYSKEKARKLLENVTKDKNVDRMDESKKGIKSSTAFFTQLQDEVRSQIKSKTKPQNTKTKQIFNAKRLKL